MSRAVSPLPNTPAWRGAQLKAQGQLYIHGEVLNEAQRQLYLTFSS
jgi:hypothetical protein